MVARWQRDEPGFVLGAMLPDLASMCGARLQEAVPEPLAAGVTFHHRSDAAFHDTAAFTELCAEARASLEAAGTGRYVAMAAAHVGIELLLDGVWLDEPGVDEAYLRAIAHTEELGTAALRWRRAEHGDRFSRLCERLRAWGSPDGYRDPDEVGRRLARILARRPRLAPGPGDEARLIAWAHEARPAVAAAAPRLREELADRLGPGDRSVAVPISRPGGVS